MALMTTYVSKNPRYCILYTCTHTKNMDRQMNTVSITLSKQIQLHLAHQFGISAVLMFCVLQNGNRTTLLRSGRPSTTAFSLPKWSWTLLLYLTASTENITFGLIWLNRSRTPCSRVIVCMQELNSVTTSTSENPRDYVHAGFTYCP